MAQSLAPWPLSNWHRGHRQVDAALSGFGMAMGPFEMADLAGNDIGYNVRRERGIVDKDTGKPTDPTQR